MEALKNGKLQLALGGGGGGPLWGGKGVKTDPMKDDAEGKARLTAMGKNAKFGTQSKVSKEFAKYAAMGMKPSKHMPNAVVKGARNNNNTELVQQYKGNPEQGVRSGTPYYEAAQVTGRASESAVDKENIPAPYRKQVKEYFETLRK